MESWKATTTTTSNHNNNDKINDNHLLLLMTLLFKARELRKGRFLGLRCKSSEAKPRVCSTLERLVSPIRPSPEQPSCGRGEAHSTSSAFAGVVFKVTHLPLIRVPVAMGMVYYCEVEKMANSRILPSSFTLSPSSEDFSLLFSSQLT